VIVKLTKVKLKEYRKTLPDYCQIQQDGCSGEAQDAHHLFYGRFGADKDDRWQVSVCRVCHQWCHSNKMESQDKYQEIAVCNWNNYDN